MNIDFPSCGALIDFARSEQLYLNLIAQLRKDFGLANVSLDVGAQPTPEKLQSLIREKVYQLIMERFDEYLHLLYIIDVPEEVFKNVHMTDVVEVAEQMTFLILKRELQKVWFKKKYTS